MNIYVLQSQGEWALRAVVVAPTASAAIDLLNDGDEWEAGAPVGKASDGIGPCVLCKESL